MRTYGVGKLVDACFPLEPVSRDEARKIGRILHKRFDYNNLHEGRTTVGDCVIIGVPDRIEWHKVRELKTFFNSGRMDVAYRAGDMQANMYCLIFGLNDYQVDLYDITNDELIEGKVCAADTERALFDIRRAISHLEARR